ncbi:hypothetical protein JOD63_002865 [Microbacterium terrae]|uniref:Uncharacterized protein n=1 Tax=Microbacterium terrae TaxID=69369 RepID=A0A0M2H3S8_9MICO|nr:hypothetical protein [Microbacterium terrae]KJL38460.1 hypothetical protein RS81_02734 [Microbacterium terrae]MBP1078897.1 hypothetical protein [Microbacterium terrae]GLJ98297.1 hypothetical protein GCM10017594_14940 [Microbacterium terrae]
MAELDRRAALLLLGALPAGVLLGCAPDAAPAARATPRPTPKTTTLATSGAGPTGALAAASYGPNGTHWPSRTPRATDTFDVVVEADCTWAAISKAIAYVDERSRDGAGAVLVKPGTLPGNGAGSSSAPVIQLVGSSGRASRVLVAPRDGIGSITHTGSIRIDRVKGVSFVGFWTHPNSVVLTSVEDVAWAWSKGQAFNATAGKGGPLSNVEFVECVTPDAKLTESDAWAFRTAGNVLDGVSVIGCYIAPSYKPAGSTAHCDTLQLSGDKAQANITLKDTVLFASTNAGFIPSGLAKNVMFDGSLLVAGDRMLQRYPVPAQANNFTSGAPAAVNGSGTRGILSSRGSTFIGIVRGEWASVQSSTISGSASVPVASGGFTSDPSLAKIDAAWLERTVPVPSDDRLRAIWAL